MKFLIKGLLVLMFSLLFACGSDQADNQPKVGEAENSAELDDHEKTYKAKVNKRMKNAVYKSAVKELGKFGVSEQQVKCILEDHSYYQLSSQKNTPEIQAVFEDCGVSMQQLKGWYD